MGELIMSRDCMILWSAYEERKGRALRFEVRDDGDKRVLVGGNVETLDGS